MQMRITVRGQGIKFGDEQFARKLDNGKISEKNGTGGPEDNSTFKMLRPGRVIVPTDGQPETNKANKSNLNIAKKGKFRLDVSHDTTSRTEWQDVEEGKKIERTLICKRVNMAGVDTRCKYGQTPEELPMRTPHADSKGFVTMVQTGNTTKTSGGSQIFLNLGNNTMRGQEDDEAAFCKSRLSESEEEALQKHNSKSEDDVWGEIDRVVVLGSGTLDEERDIENPRAYSFRRNGRSGVNYL